MDSNLKQLLYTHTETEEWHRTHPGELSPRYNRVETTTINGEEVYLFDWKETLDENPVGLIKESRFTDITTASARLSSTDGDYSLKRATCSFATPA